MPDKPLFRRLLKADAFAALIALTGCVARVGVGYRVYDPYRSDYHDWDDREEGNYSRWERETHRKHRDFRKLRADDQREYWEWRHGRQ